MTITAPTMPDSSSLYNTMVANFGTAGTIGLSVIGGAIALGGIVILALWGWRLLKKWLTTAK